MNRRVGLEKKGWTGGRSMGVGGAGGGAGGWREAGRGWRLPDGRGRWRGVSLGRTAPPGRQPSPLQQMAFWRMWTYPRAPKARRPPQAEIAAGDPCRHHDGDVHHGGGGLDWPRSWSLSWFLFSRSRPGGGGLRPPRRSQRSSLHHLKKYDHLYDYADPTDPICQFRR